MLLKQRTTATNPPVAGAPGHERPVGGSRGRGGRGTGGPNQLIPIGCFTAAR